MQNRCLKPKRALTKALPIIFSFFLCSFSASPVMPVSAEEYTVSTGSGAWTKKSDNLYVMDIDGDGKADVTLTKNGNEWTYQFNVSKSDQDYYIYENMMTELENKGYTSSGSDGNEGTKRDPGVIKGTQGKNTYTLTNTKKHTKKTYGNLKIQKKVVNANNEEIDMKASFPFTITLSGDTEALRKEISGNKVFGDVAFKDGVGKVTLNSNKSVTLNNIPTGIQYSISEDTVKGYITSWSGETGFIAADTTSTAVCTNQKQTAFKDQMAQSKFKIKKLVEAIDEDMGHSYLEHVSLSGLSGNKTYSYVKYDATTKNTTTIEFTANSQGEAVVDIPMKHGDTADFTVDAGVEYQITEDGGNFVSSYTINSLNDKGSIAKNNSDQLTKAKGLSTEVETADENESVEVVFKSVYEYTQSLTIAKKTGRQRVLGMADYDSDDEFEFTIEFFEMAPNTFFESDVGVVRADEDGEAIKTFNLKNGQSVAFKDMPEGVKYRITETKTDTWMPTYEFRDTKKVVRDADKSSKNTQLETADETVDRGENATVTFTNLIPLELPNTGGIGTGIICAAGAGIIVLSRKSRKMK